VITTNHRLGDLDERLRARLGDKRVARVLDVQRAETPLVEAQLGWSAEMRQQRLDNFQRALTGLSRDQNDSLDSAYIAAWNFATSPRRWLVLVGDVGCGKTHLAAAIKNDRDSQGEPAFFAVVPDLLDYLRATYAPNSDVTYDRGFDAIRSAPVLILDDYGAHSSTTWAEEKLFQLLNYRFNARMPTVITTNLRFDRPETLSPNQQELRIYSRLIDLDLSQVVRIDAPRYKRTELATQPRSDMPRRVPRQSPGRPTG
jgi:DNA replication protein DnaC